MWAMLYTLSILGQWYTNNCPFCTSKGYGDGQDLPVVEINLSLLPSSLSSNNNNVFPLPPPNYLHSCLEFQLKGAGLTLFCWGANGCVVLWSSVQEFLASNAMHNLGVGTMHALSLVVSKGPNSNTSQRPWHCKSMEKTTTTSCWL